MRFHLSFDALLLGLPLAAPFAFAAEDVSLAPEVQRRFVVVVLARRIRGYAATAKASSDYQVERGRLLRRQAKQSLAISLEGLGIIGACWGIPMWSLSALAFSACGMTAVFLIQ